jgi:hypothetical protein
MKLQLASHRASFIVALIIAVLVAAPMTPIVRASTPGVLTADLDGKMIDLTTVGTLHCHDFDYPRIHCFKTAEALATAIAPELAPALAAASTDYVQVFDGASYSGASMVMSQDYSVLSVIGWNDRISSFKGLNGRAGKFFVDWFNGGSSWSFCCNQNATSLGSFNDTFSSVTHS